ncbi:Fc.00g062280.m01.CDS01 [Cosmosporella sp. VM-42]
MGSQVGEHDELTVLVTGFGPFREQYPVNPSWEIAKDLPKYLPPLRAKDPHSRRQNTHVPEVRILVHPEPIRVNYKVVRELVPSFWQTYQGRKVDIAIHIGMAGPRPFYCIERKGHRDGYRFADVDGEKLDEEAEKKSGDKWIWHGLPDELETELDVEDVLTRWQGMSSEDADLRISEDAGRYMCDFIYYSSLAQRLKQEKPRKVVFLHVPSDASEKSVTQGKELMVNLIRSIVESEVEKIMKEQGSGAAGGEL